MNEVIDFKKLIIDKFDGFERSLDGNSSAQLDSIKKDALAKFSSLKFPTIKDEEWRFTNISPLLKFNFNPVVGKKEFDTNEFGKLKLKDSFNNRLVFVDGIFSTKLSETGSLSKLMIAKNLKSAVKENNDMFHKYFNKYADYNEQIFASLNTAYCSDGAFIVIPENKIIEEPIFLLFISTSNEDQALLQPRNLFISGKNSEATIIEQYIGLADNVYFTNAVSEVVVGENARLNHIKIQEESGSAFHISKVEADQERNSNYESISISLGAEISRDEISATFKAEGSECTLNGLYLTNGSQLHDTHTMINHAKPFCNSHEHFKGILEGKSRGVFNGKVIVRPNAQKTNAFQENNNIILSNEALVNTKPQLEIFADDVKCSHGATIGQIDNESLFYLKSRGIGEENARTILIHAFAGDVVKTIKSEAIKNYLEEILDKRFNKES